MRTAPAAIESKKALWERSRERALVQDNDQDEDVSWRIAAQVWWALAWRWVSVTVVAGGVVSALLIIFPLHNDLAIGVGLAENLIIRSRSQVLHNEGLGLIVLSPSMLKEHFPKRLPESLDRVTILRGPTGAPVYKINQTDVQKAELLPRLTEMYKNRAERVLFIRADNDLYFAYVAEVIDIANGADVDHVAVLTPKMLAGH